jgi:homoserine O-succinyltransferase/O-acetyltransferase
VVVRLVRAAAARPNIPREVTEVPPRWTCAFVNNMPDGAFDATERQFLDLLETCSGDEVIEVRRYGLAGVPRGERVAARIAEEYSPIAGIGEDPPGLLIVTGSNPLEAKIEDEPYWGELIDLLTWGTEHVASMVLSCLSAHAALTHFDGIERIRLASKCTGVFLQEVDLAHPLLAGVDSQVSLPHSRLSTVPMDLIERAGYRVAIHSEAVGWGMATRTIGEARVVLIQGHPEYDASSLLREYHRDARRFVLHERDEEPVLPFHCVAQPDWEQLKELHRTITGETRAPAVLEAYPFDEVGARATSTWHGVAERLYTNWLTGITTKGD